MHEFTLCLQLTPFTRCSWRIGNKVPDDTSQSHGRRYNSKTSMLFFTLHTFFVFDLIRTLGPAGQCYLINPSSKSRLTASFVAIPSLPTHLTNSEINWGIDRNPRAKGCTEKLCTLCFGRVHPMGATNNQGKHNELYIANKSPPVFLPQVSPQFGSSIPGRDPLHTRSVVSNGKSKRRISLRGIL